MAVRGRDVVDLGLAVVAFGLAAVFALVLGFVALDAAGFPALACVAVDGRGRSPGRAVLDDDAGR